MSYLSDWKSAEEAAAAARAANPLCDQSAICPAPDGGHLVGCRGNRMRIAQALRAKGLESTRCPTCTAPAPHLHPAVQHEGEVQPCADPFHERVTPQNTPARIAEHRALLAKLGIVQEVSE